MNKQQAQARVMQHATHCEQSLEAARMWERFDDLANAAECYDRAETHAYLATIFAGLSCDGENRG